MTAICSSCGGVGHSRSTHRNCPNNPRSHTVNANVPINRTVNTPASIAIASSTSVTRPIPAARVVPFQESRLRGRNIYENGRHIFPAMDATCRHCKAKTWPHEKSSGTLNQPIFTLCCANGRVILPDIEPVPKILDKLTGGTNAHALCRRQIRKYNSSLAFTSCGANVDTNLANQGRGVYTFRIQGSVYHSHGSLYPREGDRAKFAQIYIFMMIRNSMFAAMNCTKTNLILLHWKYSSVKSHY